MCVKPDVARPALGAREQRSCALLCISDGVFRLGESKMQPDSPVFYRVSRLVTCRVGRISRLLLPFVLLASLMFGLAAISPQGASAATYQDWPMFLQNQARTAATTDPKLSVSTAATLKLKFSYLTGGPIATSVSIVGTTAYVGTWDGYEYAINTSTGSLIWKTFIGTTTDPGCNPVNIG